MGRPKKSKPSEVEIEDVDGAEVYEDEIPELASLKAQLGDEQLTVRVQRKADDGTWEKFPSLPLESFDPDSIVAKYGGGEWRFAVVDSKHSYVRHFKATYSKSIKPLPNVEAAKSTSIFSSPDFAVIQQMQAQNMQMMAQMQAQTQGLMGEVVKAIGANKGPSLIEIVGLLKGLKDLDRDPKAEASHAEVMKTMLSTAKEMFKAGQETAAGVDPQESILNKLVEAIPGVMEKIGAVVQARPTSANVARRALPAREPATVPAPAPASSAAPVPAVYANVLTFIKQAGPDLMRHAQNGADPAQVAQALVSRIPTQYDEEVSNFAEDPKAADMVYAAYSPLAPYLDWVKKFIKGVGEQYTEQALEESAQPAEITVPAINGNESANAPS